MQYLTDLVPGAEQLVAMDEQHLALEMLQVLKSWEDRPIYQNSLEMFTGAALNDPLHNKGYNRPDLEDEIRGALSQSWEYLRRSRLIVPDSAYPGGTVFKVSSKGNDTLLLPRDKRRFGTPLPAFTHEKIRNSVASSYDRAEYEKAIFAAMREVEIYVREASNLPPGVIGTDLMRRAFNAETGPLTDMSADKGERQARSDLFAGAIGSYKNPSSHRVVDYESPDEALEIIALASHLLRIVDARRSAGAA